MPSILQRIRQKIRSGKYRFTWHMEFETMPDHNLISLDIESAILGGSIVGSRYDEYGTQYLVEGHALDDRMILVAVRFAAGEVVIIAAYE